MIQINGSGILTGLAVAGIIYYAWQTNKTVNLMATTKKNIRSDFLTARANQILGKSLDKTNRSLVKEYHHLLGDDQSSLISIPKS